METAFTPWHAIGGGLLIGLSAALYWIGEGHITGISGIVSRAFSFHADRETQLRWSFLAGLALSPWLAAAITGALHYDFQASYPALLVSGFLVGLGTVLGNGCTSGHGVCGLARLSPRSIAATAIFMVIGMATVFGIRHALGG